MIRRVLIANRGEVAVRIIRTCRDMNLEMVTVFSEADRDALFSTLATQSVCVGPARAADSYLNQDNIIAAALKTGCDAVHPGYGFLSENADFAKRVVENGLVFIGPPSGVIRAMGDKSHAKSVARSCGVPVVPGSDGAVASYAEARAVADAIGYPVLIKASAGGGGRGMRRVDGPDSLEQSYADARAEAHAAFGDGSVYVEKLITNTRHIEIQIFADTHGNCVHLGERECSVQRRNQKVIEEAPSKAVSETLRTQLGEYALRIARASGYVNAGTVEFILSPDGEPYFIEMNTRLQVEHPVTEAVTGIDIVREQIRIASGMEISFTQNDVKNNGHAIECRVCAEDPANAFAPSPGRVDFLHLPDGFGVRCDSALFSGCEISPHYDSLVAKVVAHGKTRSEAVYRMRRALEEFVIEGVKTNLGLLYMVMYAPKFLSGRYDTSFLDANLNDLLSPIENEPSF